MAYKKGLHLHSSNGGANRGRPWALMLLLAFGAALLGVMVLHKLRDKRIYNLLVKEKDRDLLALHLLLQKEGDHAEELERKNEEMKAKTYSLGSQKMELDRRVLEMQSTMDSLKDEQKMMESVFEEKQNEIRMLQERWSYLGKENPQVIALRENLKQKEAEIEGLKSQRLSINDPTNHHQNVSASGRMAAQAKDEQLHNSTTNEDASKSKLTKFINSDVTLQIEHENGDRLGNHDGLTEPEEHDQRQEALQVEATGGGRTASETKKNEESRDDDSARITDKEIAVKMVDGKANKTIRERQRGLKRKHDHVRRSKGKRWRAIIKNRLLGRDGISEIHGEVNMNSRKVYRDEQDELKDRTEGRVSNDDNVEKEEEEMVDSNPSKDKAEAKSVKPENREEREDAQNKIVTDTTHQSKEIEKNEVRQRHINKVEKNEEQADTGMVHEEPEELNAADVQELEKDVGTDDEKENNDDDFF